MEGWETVIQYLKTFLNKRIGLPFVVLAILWQPVYNRAYCGAKIDPQRLPYRLEIIKSKRWEPAKNQTDYFVDLDLDGKSEHVLVKTNETFSAGQLNNLLIINSLSDLVVSQLNFEGSIHAGFLDLIGDERKEIFISELLNDSVYVHLYDSRGEEIYSYYLLQREYFNNHKDWVCSLNAIGSFDFNDDGRRDIVALANTSHAYQPRGVYIVDAMTGAIFYRKLGGGSTTEGQLAHIDGDGKYEIVVRSDAAANSD